MGERAKVGRLEPVLRAYDWGSVAAIPDFLGIPSTGEPMAEAWFGAHATGPSMLVTPEATEDLATAIARDPRHLLGPLVDARHHGELPYLVKVLAAARPLSIQAHPSTEQAAVGYAREEAAGVARDAPGRVYRDPNAKPEAMLALEPFELLYGFRAPLESAALLAALGVRSLDSVERRLGQNDGDALREVSLSLCEQTAAARAATIAELVTACESRPVPDHEDTCRWVARLGREFPADVGVLFALLMNYGRLERFEACFLPARTLHAYLCGVGIEVMGNSDNVLRAGLTSKFIAIDELMATLDFSPSRVEALEPSTLGTGEIRYPVPVEAFGLSLVTLEAASFDATVIGPEILIVVEGRVEVLVEHEAAVVLDQGDVLFVPGSIGRYQVRGTGRLVRSVVGDAVDGISTRP